MANLTSKLGVNCIGEASDDKVVGFDTKFVLAEGDSIKIDAEGRVYEDKTTLKRADNTPVTISYFAQENADKTIKALSLGALSRTIIKAATDVPANVTEAERAVHPALKGCVTVAHFRKALKGKTIKIDKIIEYKVPVSKGSEETRDAKKYCISIT